MPEPASEQSIFLNALALPTAAERAAYLDEVCRDKPGLRAELEALLAAHERLGGVLPPTTGQELAGAVAADHPQAPGGTNIDVGAVLSGRYKLVQQIGEGGMGTVWMAQQQEPVKRLVALKVVKPGMDSKQVLARFEAERQALALMEHPNIARVFDAGTTATGSPFFVMELVKGVPLTKYCDEHRLTPKQRLELFIPVCQAIQHAHQKGIIHRDIKPSNVLVALYDGQPVPKVIDFGIAKATGQQLTEHTLVTGFGAVVGTLECMSPEQAELNQLDIDTRSDIYSLGVLLYELLTGSTPLERKRLKQAAMAEVLRLIREEEPPRPSTRLSTTEGLPTVAANRGLEPKKLSGLVRGEIDWIVMKALEKDRNRRYDSAHGFAQDIQRYLHDEPVAAGPPSAWYRGRKFVRRHRAGVLTTAAVLLVVLVAGAGVGWVVWERAGRRTETDRAVSVALARAEQWAGQAEDRRSATSLEAKDVLAVWGQADAALAEAEAALHTGAGDETLRQRVTDVRRRLEAGRHATEQQQAQALRREKLLRDLDAARMQTPTFETVVQYAEMSAKCRAAFAAYGLEIKAGDTSELARRIRAEEPAVRDALIVALETWVWTAYGQQRELDTLRAVVMAADDDPWRKRYRAASVSYDLAALRDLSAEARRSSLPPASLILLASNLHKRGERGEAVALLRWARDQYPGDFWVHYNLGRLLRENAWNSTRESPGKVNLVELEEGIGCYRAALALRPEAAEAHIVLGEALREKGLLDQAIAEFRKAVDIAPTYSSSHFLLARTLRDSGRQDEALAVCRKCTALNPNEAWAHGFLGDVLRAEQQWQEASAAYRQAIELQPQVRTFYVDLARAMLHLKVNDRKDDVAAARKAVELYPQRAEVHIALGEALKDRAGSLAAFRQAIKLDPSDALADYLLGRMLLSGHPTKAELEEAAAALSKGIELTLNADNWCLRGQAYQKLGLWQKALDDYCQATEMVPYHWGALTGRAQVYDATGQWAKALAEYEKAIEAAKRYRGLRSVYISQLAQAHAILGNALRAREQWDEASAAYRRAIEVDPEDGRLCLSLGRAGLHLKMDDPKDNVAAARKAVELCPQMAAAHFALGWTLGHQDRAETLAAFRKAIDLDPAFKRAHIWLGQTLVLSTNKADLEDAVAAYSKAIEIAPNDHGAWYSRGYAHQKLGLWQKALEDYSRAIQLIPTHTAALRGRAEVYAATGQWARANADYENAIKAEASYSYPALRPVLYNGLAWLLATCPEARFHNPKRAVEVASKAVELMPRVAGYQKTLGVAYYHLGEDEAALAALNKSLELGGGGDVSAWLFLAMVHHALGDRNQARNWYVKAVAWMEKTQSHDAELARFRKDAAELPGMAGETKPNERTAEDVATLLKRGMDSYQKGQRVQALAHYTRATRLAPKNVGAWNMRGDACSALGQYEDARTCFSRALEINPEAAYSWLGRGFTYLMLKQWDKAVADYTEAIKRAPKAAGARWQRGDAYLAQEKWDEALADYSAALENQSDGRHIPAWQKRADLYVRLGQWAKAKSDYEEAIKRVPKNAPARNSLAWLLATCPEGSVRDPARAVVVAKGTVEIAPTWRTTLTTLGVAHYRAGNWPEAQEALTKGVKLFQGHVPAYFFLAMTHQRLGNRQEAHIWYARAVERMVNHPQDAELARFRQEAAELLGITDKKISGAKK